MRELHQGVGHGRDGAETEFLRLDHRHVLAAALGQQRAKVIDLDRWAVVNSQVEITSPWVALGDTPTRIWSLPRGEVASLNASHEVTHRTTAPAALAAPPVASAPSRRCWRKRSPPPLPMMRSGAPACCTAASAPMLPEGPPSWPAVVSSSSMTTR